jgi:RNA recognition motif-containing protein
MKRIYVGNLPFSASEEQIRTLFSQYGNVHSVKLITDRETARPRGFGFVEMEAAEADAAIAALNEKAFNGRTLKINEARARTGGSGYRKEGSAISG